MTSTANPKSTICLQSDSRNSRNVSFDESVKCVRHVTLNEYSDEEHLSTFYNREDFHLFKMATYKRAKYLDWNPDTDTKDSFRGVEQYTSEEANLMLNRRDSALKIVSQLQHSYPIMMVRLLCTENKSSQKEAHERGLADEIEARKIHQKSLLGKSKSKETVIFGKSASVPIVHRRQRISRAA